MAVRVGNAWSAPRQVTGGCPQGSILGMFLFNATTDDLEDDFLRREQEDIPDDDYCVLPPTTGCWASPREPRGPRPPLAADEPTTTSPPLRHL